MKQLITSLFFILIFLVTVFSQVPQAINYQAVLRDSTNTPITEQPISVKISILKGSANGTVIYSEIHADTTNSFGQFTILIGMG